MKVLSTRTGRLWACATADTPAMSTSLRVGFVGDSTHTILVFSFTNLVTFAGSVRSTKSNERLFEGVQMRRNRRLVPPYTSSHTITCEPVGRQLTTADVAAKPEANPSPCFPFSHLAMSSSKAFLVGFPDLEYSNSLNTPGEGCWNVVAKLMGTITAPVSGLGGWPAWMVSVPKWGKGGRHWFDIAMKLGGGGVLVVGDGGAAQKRRKRREN
mmetsp:Transcript_31323/g.78611  ORF Transcript_31323/g.78611 Transcript_31323/m.78611 type:complete len:212 (+) Transcript_31323:680-1315(+)